MRKMLTLCTKNVHFTLNNEIYVQNNGVAIDSALGPVLAYVFTVELEKHWFAKMETLCRLYLCLC